MDTTHNSILSNEHSSGKRHERLDVILPAGGRITGEFAQSAGTEIKALINLNGQTILRRAIQTLRATGRAGRIVVIGPPPALEEARTAGADALLPEAASGPDNILRGLKWLQEEEDKGRQGDKETRRQGEEKGRMIQSPILNPQSSIHNPQSRVLIMTTDLPFLTADALNTFLDACPPEADVAVPLMTEGEFAARFPGTENEYVRLKDGKYTLGCAFVVRGATLLHNEAHLRALFAARKSPWQMARLIGLGTILKFATRRLTVEELQARASVIGACNGIAIRHMPPELAYDIDLPAEYVYARDHAPRASLPIASSNAPGFSDRVQETAP